MITLTTDEAIRIWSMLRLYETHIHHELDTDTVDELQHNKELQVIRLPRLALLIQALDEKLDQ
jgi:hypothetical protein